MDLSVICDMVAAFRRAGAHEFELSHSRFSIRGRFSIGPAVDVSAPRADGTAPAFGAGEYSSALELSELYERGKLTVIRASTVGRWRPSRDLTVGSFVDVDAVVGTLNVVGVTMTVSTPTSGTVLTFYTESDEPVQYGQLLCAIRREATPTTGRTSAGLR